MQQIASTTPPTPVVKAAMEGYAQTLYGYSVFSKARWLCNASGYVAHDLLNLANSCLPRFYLQIQAASNPLFSRLEQTTSQPNNVQSFAHSFFNFAQFHSQAKEIVNFVHHHPAIIFLRKFCFIKQTCDFSIALAQWVTGNRSNYSMLNNAVNTALSYIPMGLTYTAMGSTFPAQVLGNIILLGCLAYSIRQDILGSIDHSNRESSPTVSLIRNYALPKLQNLCSRLFSN